MSTNERIKGIQVHRPIIYGSHARLLTEEEKATAPPGHTHRWSIFLTSAATPPPAPKASSSNDPPPIDLDYIAGGADDMSYLIKRVVFRLHETYPNPNRMCEKPPYRVTETGWGEFTVPIKITFVPEAGEKAMTLNHAIKLHHWGEPIEPPLPLPVPPATGETPAGTPKVEKTESEAATVPKTEADQTPAPEATPAAAAPAESSAPASEAATGATTEAATPADASVSATPAAGEVEFAPLPILPTVASAFPVHAWQYDELVFSDPLTNFLNVLNEHPPTPLPAKNRRPRDQREEYELKQGKKKARASASARPSISRAGTESRAGTPLAGTPGAQPIGVPGELGSADVPLEFTQEMEKSEHNRLTEMRIRIVEQMDRWREKLIANEKELGKLKEELRP
ncbi:NuA4 histone H4 acetyltransferase complex and the SWR1 complex subunit [Vanrija albida]|uniref:Protein AF-9 homolog n=1 Tax=Vanrija albida TaxID=181172 RepID=A0ABR3QDD8_9TREE